MSISTHLGFEPSRKDDMESFGYVLIYLMKGKLPWQGLKVKTKQERSTKVCDIKSSISIEKLCKGCPEEFQKIMISYFNHVKNLDFEETPNYSFVRRLFSSDKHFANNNPPLIPEDNFRFDWQSRLRLIWSRTHLIPGLPVPHVLSPWANGPQKFGPHGQMVPNQFGPPAKTVPNQFGPPGKTVPMKFGPMDKWSPKIWFPWTNGPQPIWSPNFKS